MDETQETPKLTIKPTTQLACDIATGRVQADQSATGHSITGAKKDLNAKGRGPEWYRMVWRNGEWQYVSDERLPRGNFLAADRRASVSGDVYDGELVCSHDRGSKVDAMWIIRAPDAEGKVMVKVEFVTRRDGQFAVKLPDGSEVLVPNPRK